MLLNPDFYFHKKANYFHFIHNSCHGNTSYFEIKILPCTVEWIIYFVIDYLRFDFCKSKVTKLLIELDFAQYKCSSFLKQINWKMMTWHVQKEKHFGSMAPIIQSVLLKCYHHMWPIFAAIFWFVKIQNVGANQVMIKKLFQIPVKLHLNLYG